MARVGPGEQRRAEHVGSRDNERERNEASPKAKK